MLECALVLRMMYPRGVCSRYNLTTLVDRRHIACVWALLGIGGVPFGCAL